MLCATRAAARVSAAHCARARASGLLILARRDFKSHPSTTPNREEDANINVCIEEAAKVLPTQAILDNFVHENPLHYFDEMPFHDAIAHVRELELHMAPGERCFATLGVDPRPRVDAALSDLCATFLDRGAARWSVQNRDRGFLYFFASLEGVGFAPWRRRARVTAQSALSELELAASLDQEQQEPQHRAVAESQLMAHLELFSVPPEEWSAVLRSTMLELRGWAGMFANMESTESDRPPGTTVRLVDFLAVRSILMESSIESVGSGLGKLDQVIFIHSTHTPLTFGPGFADLAAVAEKIKSDAPKKRTASEVAASADPKRHTSGIAHVDQQVKLRSAPERSEACCVSGASP